MEKLLQFVTILAWFGLVISSIEVLCVFWGAYYINCTEHGKFQEMRKRALLKKRTTFKWKRPVATLLICAIWLLI